MAQISKADSLDFDWIYKGIAKRPTNPEISKKTGNQIQFYIPPQFEVYCKILHPFTIDLDKPDILYKELVIDKNAEELETKKLILSYFDIKDTTALSMPLEQFNAFITRHIVKKHNIPESDLQKPLGEMPKDVQRDFKTIMNIIFKPLKQEEQNPIENREWENVKRKELVQWQTICEKFGLKLHNQVNHNTFYEFFKKNGFPVNLWLPNTELPKEHLDILANFLKEITTNETVWWFDDHDYLYKKASVINVIQKPYQEYKIVGGHIFDATKTWLLWTDEHRDLDVTLFAGTKEMVERLKKSGLEIIECLPETRIDWQADEINKN